MHHLDGMFTFTSNCTIPPEGVKFVGTPPIRGTPDIIWGCGTVLVTCTWSILHLNVPLQSKLRPGDTKQQCLRAAVQLVNKINWMMINIYAPEWPLAKAFSDFRSVKLLEKCFKDQSQ